MSKIILIMLMLLCTGCIGSRIFKGGERRAPPVPSAVELFEAMDADGNGSIDREEYYSNSVSINTDQPTTGLGWIMLAVIICTFGSAFVYRRKKDCGCN
jgi:hypothetical protein